MGSKQHCEIIHCDKANKQIFLNEARNSFIKAHPELHGTKITQNQLMSSILRYYIGLDYYEHYSEYNK